MTSLIFRQKGTYRLVGNSNLCRFGNRQERLITAVDTLATIFSSVTLKFSQRSSTRKLLVGLLSVYKVAWLFLPNHLTTRSDTELILYGGGHSACCVRWASLTDGIGNCGIRELTRGLVTFRQDVTRSRVWWKQQKKDPGAYILRIGEGS